MHQANSQDGTSIAYRQSGSGPPLVIVHGMVADHKSWSRIAPYFDADFTVMAVDRRGRGDSGDAPDYSLAREVEDVVAVVEAAAASHGEPVFLFGHSLGGLFCLEAALETDQISRLILYEPHIPSGESSISAETLAKIETLVGVDDLDAAMVVFLGNSGALSEKELAAYRQTPLWTERLPLARTIVRETELDTTYEFDPGRYAGLQKPVLLLQGGNSLPVYQHMINRVNAALPDSRVVILPGQEHLAHHTNPQLLATEVRRFLMS